MSPSVEMVGSGQVGQIGQFGLIRMSWDVRLGRVLGLKKFVWSKQFWSLNLLGSKIKKNCDQTFWIPENSKELKSKKFYGPKRFGISKYFEPQKMLGPKRFLIPKYLGWKNSGCQTNLDPKKLLLLFKFRLWKTKSTPSLTRVSSWVGVW